MCLSFWCCVEKELLENSLKKAIQTLTVSELIRIKTEVLFDVSRSAIDFYSVGSTRLHVVNPKFTQKYR